MEESAGRTGPGSRIRGVRVATAMPGTDGPASRPAPVQAVEAARTDPEACVHGPPPTNDRAKHPTGGHRGPLHGPLAAVNRDPARDPGPVTPPAARRTGRASPDSVR